MNYTVELKPAATRQLRKLPKTVQRRLVKSMEDLGKDPFPPGAAKLSGEVGLFRVRVGDYRILYSVENAKLVVLVVSIGHRREVYR